MSFKIQLGAAVMAAGLAFTAVNASAATFVLTYRGTVVDVEDDYGLFGAPPSQLETKAFTLKFTVNTDAPGLAQTGGAFWDSLDGGGLVSAVFTLNGKQVAFGADLGKDYREDGSLNPDCDGWMCQRADLEHFAGDYLSTDTHYRKISASANAYSYYGLFGGITHTAPNQGVYTAEDGADFYGWFSADEYTTDDNGRHDLTHAFAKLKMESLTVTTGVPEPQTWALAILGFGLTGSMLRRRRAQLAVVAAIA